MSIEQSRRCNWLSRASYSIWKRFVLLFSKIVLGSFKEAGGVHRPFFLGWDNAQLLEGLLLN